jgi:hypothetical protein
MCAMIFCSKEDQNQSLLNKELLLQLQTGSFLKNQQTKIVLETKKLNASLKVEMFSTQT